MNILEIYNKYQIMPQLMEHQLRVAGVASMTLDNFNGDTDTDNIVRACLLHDMGNILKFDLAKSGSLLNIDIDVEFWENIKEEFRAKYGSDEHHASLEIAREAGVSERVLELIDCIRFERAGQNAAAKDFGKKICDYSDNRVGPLGVISLEERLMDLRARYAHRHTEWGAEDARKAFENSAREIQKQIFSHCKIKPEEITQETVREKVEQLRKFEI